MLDGGFLEPRVAALENNMALMGSDLHAALTARAGVGGMTDSLSPATNKSQDIYGSGGETFNHRWKVTVTREVEPDGAASWTVNIRPGSVWTAAEDGAVEAAALTPVAPVAADAENGGWKIDGATSGSLYVAIDAAGANLLKYGDPAAESAAVILRIADVTVASSGATLIQRQIGDALTGGASGLQLGPLTYETDGDTKRFVRYMGAWAFDADNDRWTFAKAVKTDGSQYPAAETLSAREMLFRVGGTIYVAYRPDIGPAPTRWMSRVTVRVSQGIDITPPQSDTDTGSVSETTRDLIYFTDDTTANASTDYPLSIQVAEANDATAYDS